MATTTPAQAFPVMEDSDDPDIPEDVMALALAIERRVVGVYNSATDRDTKVSAPQEGQVAYLKDTNTFTFYNASAWVNMITGTSNTTFPAITSGTAAPSGGVDGDVYLKV